MSLAPDFLQRAAPPGSMRYFALLYAAPEERELLGALLVIDTEVRASIQAAHEVAHTRLQWWRAEIDRLVNRNAQHPATRVLQKAVPNTDFAHLHELLVAADMDVASMTFHTKAELDGYLVRSGSVLELSVTQSDLAARRQAQRAGALIRRVETLRDLCVEAQTGRVYMPLDDLEAQHVSLDQLRGKQPSAAAIALVASEVARVQTELNTLSITSRPLTILVQLHAQLLARIAKANHDVFSQRHELGPLKKVWTAWRAARRV